MEREHPGANRRGQPARAIATVNDARPWRGPPNTFLADGSLAEESSRGTDQSLVVHRLHHRDTLFASGVIRRRSHQGKRVVEVRDIRPRLSEQAHQLAVNAA